MTAMRGERILTAIRPAHVAVAAVLAALAFSFVLYPLIAGPLQAERDPDRFGELGTNIALGKGFVYGSGDTAVVAFDRAPLYPLTVAFFRLTLHEHFIAGLQIWQALLHGLTGLLVYRLGRHLADHRRALIAQAVHAFHPVLIWYTARVWIETTNTFLTVLVVLMTVLLLTGGSTMKIVRTGLVVGLAVLTKGVILFLPLVFIVVLMFRRHWQAARALVLATGIALVVIAPWTVRNAVEGGRYIPVHTSLGMNLMVGEAIAGYWTDAPFSTLILWERGHVQAMQVLAGTGYDAVSPGGDAMLVGYVIDSWLREPGTFLRHVAVNAASFWYLSESTLKSVVLLCLQLPLMAFALRGARRARRQNDAVILIVLAVLYFWGVHALIVGWLRYAVPVVPLLILLAVAGMTHPSVEPAGAGQLDPGRRNGR